MIRRPLWWLKHQTRAPTGHSITAAIAKATNPTVGPKILQWHGFRLDPHSMQHGIHGILPDSPFQAQLGRVERPQHELTRAENLPQIGYRYHLASRVSDGRERQVSVNQLPPRENEAPSSSCAHCAAQRVWLIQIHKVTQRILKSD